VEHLNKGQKICRFCKIEPVGEDGKCEGCEQLEELCTCPGGTIFTGTSTREGGET
jgi:hypothetical protein